MEISNNHASTAEVCLRKNFWNYEFRGKGLVKRGISENTAFGSLAHYALAHLYSGLGPGKSCSQAEDEWKEEYKFDELSYDEKNHWDDNFDWMQRIINEYDKYRLVEDDFAVKDIEVEGVVQLGEICYRCGLTYVALLSHCPGCGAEVHTYLTRIDLIAEKNGGLYVIDHKTTGSSGDAYLSQWHYSMQLYGYAYAYGKAVGRKVSGTCANIIRKLKRIGLEGADFKQCPQCRGGVRKRVGCTVCDGRGKVERENKPNDSAFQREWPSFDDDKAALFVRTRLRTIEDIQREQERFEVEPDAAWPMNPQNCFNMGRCPFVKMCWEGDAEMWYDPPDEYLHDFDEKEER